MASFFQFVAEQSGESGLDEQNKADLKAKTEIINKSLANSFVLVGFVFFFCSVYP